MLYFDVSKHYEPLQRLREIMANEIPPVNTQKNADPNTAFWAAHFKKNWGYHTLTLILIISNLYWFIDNKTVATKADREIDGNKQKTEDSTRSLLLNSAEHKLRLTMQTFAWAVRAAVIRQNKDEIDQYFTELVKNTEVVEVFLVEESSKIISVASNKKHEKMRFTELYDSSYLSRNEVTFDLKNRQYFLSAPLMSLDKRLGTLFLIVENDSKAKAFPEDKN
jgi:hypothetical protein